jgi:6-phosphofructokinase 2
MTILTVTLNPALDVCAEVPVVEPDHKLHCRHTELAPGGGGINVARAIHRLGGDATALFPYGGSTGEHLCDLLLGEGVSIVGIPIAGVTREDFAVKETSTGHEYRFVLPGPMLMPSELDRCAEQVLVHAEPGSFVVLSGSIPAGADPAVLAAIVTDLREKGCFVIADTSGPALAALARAGVYLLKPSVNELSGHAGRRLECTDEIVAAAQDLLRCGPNHSVLVSLGADGALLVVAGEPAVVISSPSVLVNSAVGAGDSLVAGLVLALAHGHGLVEAARRGVAAGTAATIAEGHTLCHATDVDRLLRGVHAHRLYEPDGRASASSPASARLR